MLSLLCLNDYWMNNHDDAWEEINYCRHQGGRFIWYEQQEGIYLLRWTSMVNWRPKLYYNKVQPIADKGNSVWTLRFLYMPHLLKLSESSSVGKPRFCLSANDWDLHQSIRNTQIIHHWELHYLDQSELKVGNVISIKLRTWVGTFFMTACFPFVLVEHTFIFC